MPEELQVRVHGDAALPTLIYLPGLHGDWTLVGDFRRQLASTVRFVEFTYPRTLTWSLDDYAAAIECALAQNGITAGWLLGESYGSQVLWTMIRRQHFAAQGIILAGGFVKHPLYWGVRLVEFFFARTPSRLLRWLLHGFATLAQFRYRHSPETRENFKEFIARRTELDRQAAVHRLRHVAGSDPRETARATRLPVYCLSGALDPIVPWPLTRRWLRRHCPALRGDRILWTADHNVLGTGHVEAARQTLAWLRA